MGDRAAGTGGLRALLAVTSTDAHWLLQGPRAWWELSSNSQGLRRCPPLPQHVPHRGPQAAVAMQRGDECPPQGPGASRGKRLFPAPGAPWRRGAPGPRSLSTAPTPQPSWFPPHSAGGLRSLFISVSQWLWLKAGWSRGTSGGRVSSGSSHRLLSRDHLYC